MQRCGVSIELLAALGAGEQRKQRRLYRARLVERHSIGAGSKRRLLLAGIVVKLRSRQEVRAKSINVLTASLARLVREHDDAISNNNAAD